MEPDCFVRYGIILMLFVGICIQDWDVLAKCDIMHHGGAGTCKYSNVQVNWSKKYARI